MNDRLNKVSEIGIVPISSSQPEGSNVQYDDEFELIEDELSKQGSMIDRGQVNWEKIIEASLNILSNKSKDLKVSCYLSRALFEVSGLLGLEVGLKLNYQLLSMYWGDLYPKKIRARANSYEWLADKVESSLATLSPDITQLETLSKVLEWIQKIELFLNEKLSNKAPALGNFRRQVINIIEALEIIKEQEKNQLKKIQQLSENKNDKKIEIINKNKSTETKSNNLDNSVNSNDVIIEHNRQSSINLMSIHEQSEINLSDTLLTEKDKNKIIRQCHKALANLSLWSVQSNLNAPSAYAINRFSTWMGITTIPIHNKNTTPLKPVPQDKIKILYNLYDNRDYRQLIPMVEMSFSKSPFWLDAHRLVSVSLESLGMDDSSTQVKEQLAVFLRRLPLLIDLKFSDGSCFADEQTKRWIKSEVLNNKVSQSNMSNNVNVDEKIEQAYEKIISKTRDYSKKKDLKKTIILFQNEIDKQCNLRIQTFWKYYLAKFCYDHSQYKLALFLLQEIDGFILKNNLKYWEPELVKNVLYLLILCLKNSASIDADVSEEYSTFTETNLIFESKTITRLHSRLCQLDPTLAFDV